jgi:hypothetical protein
MRQNMKEIPIISLIIDRNQKASTILKKVFNSKDIVLNTSITTDLKDAIKIIKSNNINTIFIDPTSFNLDEASDFIFSIREKYAEIVFVLYYYQVDAERNAAEFYRGERRRFMHYYKLDKQTAIGAFEDELNYVFDKIQSDLSWRMSRENILQLENEAQSILKNKNESQESKLIIDLKEIIKNLQEKTQTKSIKSKTVFFSHRFAELEYVEGLTKYLQDNGFEVVTGKSANTSISKAIIQRIKECEFFLCLMTKDKKIDENSYTTSPWILEEKGVALAYEKPLVLMIEEGVTDFGGLQGDWQRIQFKPKGFMLAARSAVQQLKSYTGEN